MQRMGCPQDQVGSVIMGSPGSEIIDFGCEPSHFSNKMWKSLLKSEQIQHKNVKRAIL